MWEGRTSVKKTTRLTFAFEGYILSTSFYSENVIHEFKLKTKCYINLGNERIKARKSSVKKKQLRIIQCGGESWTLRKKGIDLKLCKCGFGEEKRREAGTSGSRICEF